MCEYGAPCFCIFLNLNVNKLLSVSLDYSHFGKPSLLFILNLLIPWSLIYLGSHAQSELQKFQQRLHPWQLEKKACSDSCLLWHFSAWLGILARTCKLPLEDYFNKGVQKKSQKEADHHMENAKSLHGTIRNQDSGQKLHSSQNSNLSFVNSAMQNQMSNIPSL